jgi:hypothetical protein
MEATMREPRDNPLVKFGAAIDDLLTALDEADSTTLNEMHQQALTVASGAALTKPRPDFRTGGYRKKAERREAARCELIRRAFDEAAMLVRLEIERRAI